MRKEMTKDFGHLVVKIHEPTVEQIRNLLSRDDLQFDPVGFVTGTQEIPADILGLVTDLRHETLQKLTLSELKEVMEAAREMLSPFFEILEMLGIVAGYLKGMKDGEPVSSTGPAST